MDVVFSGTFICISSARWHRNGMLLSLMAPCVDACLPSCFVNFAGFIIFIIVKTRLSITINIVIIIYSVINPLKQKRSNMRKIPFNVLHID